MHALQGNDPLADNAECKRHTKLTCNLGRSLWLIIPFTWFILQVYIAPAAVDGT